MNSSTSSSSKSGVGTVAVVLLLVLVALDGITRMVMFPASHELTRLTSYPESARTLLSQPGLRVALIGNSAKDEGVDLSLVRDLLRAKGFGDVNLATFLASNAGITSWRFMAERYVWQSGLTPDLVVITYFESNLADGSEEDIGRLAQFFTTRADWLDLFRTELTTLSERVDFLLSAGSALYATRERIKIAVLARLIPGYKDFTYVLHGAAVRQARRLAEGSSPKPPTYRALSRILERARETGTRLCFIAFPMRRIDNQPPYPIDPGLERIIRAGGADFFDLRVVPGLVFEDYRDPIHMVASGRAKYSRRFSEILATELQLQPGIAQELAPGILD
jgi:hypothetical protein